jgi:glycosyltransferase involved in cell wall biosynthesis
MSPGGSVERCEAAHGLAAPARGTALERIASMMRLLYVALTENDTVRGVERYALELCRALATQHGDLVEITLLRGAWQRYFDELRDHGVRLVDAPCANRKPSRHAWLMTRLRGMSREFDHVHYGNLLPFVVPNAVPSTMTIHDVAEYALAGKYSGVQRAYRKAIGRCATRLASRLFADSEFTKSEIRRYLGVAPERIDVIYPGVDHFRPRAAGAPPPEAAGGPYFLYFGVLEETKGADTAVLAFDRLRDDPAAAGVRLLLVGRPGNAYGRLRPMIDGHRVVHVGHRDDATLQRFVAAALAVIFVSRYEGFGLPAVEAYMLNDTVIASRGNSVGEITRGFAFNVDETSIDAVADAMRAVLAGTQPRPAIGRDAVLARFSWARAARQALDRFRAPATVAAEEIG